MTRLMRIIQVILFISCMTFNVCNSKNHIHLRQFNDNNNRQHINIYTQKHSAFFNEYFKDINFLHIVSLQRHNTDENYYAKDFTSELLRRTFPDLNFPIQRLKINLQYEEQIFDQTERYSWHGKKFDLRPGQCNCTEMPNEQRILLRTQVFYKRSGVIVIIDELQILDEYLIGMAKPPFKNPNGSFVINIMTAWKMKLLPVLSNICMKMWRFYGILRFVFIFNGGDNKKVFFYDPLEKGSTLEKGSKSGSYGKLFFEDFGNNSKSLQITKPQYPITFNGYPLKVFFFDRYPSAMNWNIYPKAFLNSYVCDARFYSKFFGGYDGIFMGNLAKILNFTIITKYPNKNDKNTKYGWKSINGTIEGSVGHVMYSRVAMGGNGHFIQGYGTTSVTFLNPTYNDLLCIVTPKAKPIPKYMAVVNCFESESWLAIGVLFLILGILWYITKCINYWFAMNFTSNPSLVQMNFSLITIIIDMWLMLTSHSINIQKTKGFERIFLIGCMISSILFCSTIQGYLSKTYFKITYEKDISTLKELNDAGLKIIIPSSSFENLFGCKNSNVVGYMSQLAKKMIINEADQRYLAINFRNVAFIDRKSDYEIIKEEFEFPNGTTLLNLVDECPRITFLSFIVRRGWVFEEKFNRILGLIDASGLRSKWFTWSKRAMLLKWRLENLRIMVANYKEKTFSVEDIKIAVQLHIYGNILSVFVFILENFYYLLGKCLRKYKEN